VGSRGEARQRSGRRPHECLGEIEEEAGVFVGGTEDEKSDSGRHLTVSTAKQGDSEDDLSEDSNHPSAEAPPFAAEKVPPLRAVPPNLDLEFSTAQESDDDDGLGDEDQIEFDSPRRSPAARETDTLGHDTKAPSQHDTSSFGSRNGGNGGDDSISSSDSSSYFVRNADPEAVATELGAKPTAVRLGGNIVKSLRFESRDRKHTLLATAGESFCFPLMEKDLMDTGLKNILESA